MITKEICNTIKSTGGKDFYYNDYFIMADLPATLHENYNFEVLLIQSTEQYNVTDSAEICIPENSLVFAKKGSIHCIDNRSHKPAHISYIIFNEKLWNRIIEFLQPEINIARLLEFEQSPIVTLSLADAENILNEFKYLKLISSNPKISQSFVKQFLVMIFTKYFSLVISNGDIDPTAFKIAKQIPLWLSDTCYKMLLPQNLCRNVAYMSTLANCSMEHLSRTMKKYLNITPIEFLTNARLQFIANQLTNTTHSIIDIFVSSGYSNLSWGYSLFKEKYGMTPLKYRNKMQQ